MAGVNLLQSVMHRPGGTRAASKGRRGAVAGLAVPAIAACVLVPWSWLLHREAARLDRELGGARQASARLRRDTADADALSRTADALQRRIQAVEQVQRSRAEGLRVLTEVSAALPDDCWLSALADDESGAVKIEGRAADVASVFEFVQRMEASGAFDGGVEVLDSHTLAAAREEDQSAVFVVRAVIAARPAPQAGAPSPQPRPGSRGSG